MEKVHFRVAPRASRAYYSSTADFGQACLCFNGNFHAAKTDDESQVTCEECLKRIKANSYRYKLAKQFK